MTTTRLLWICAALWLILKLTMRSWISIEDNVIFGSMLNMFFIVLIAAFAVRNKYVNTTSDGVSKDFTLLDTIKDVCKATVSYALLATILVGSYYFVISPTEVQQRKALAETQIEKVITPEYFVEMQEANPIMESMDYQEYKDQQLENAYWIYSPLIQITLTLVALMVCALLYGILITVLWRTFMT